MKLLNILLATSILATVSCTTTAKQDSEWINCFNGKDLDGLFVKIKGSEPGVNRDNIFRVEDGLLTVSYADFQGEFKDQFGHIFIDRPFTNYHFKCEYRFIGEQVGGGPGWAFANSGAMLSGQDPRTMEANQKFPDSIEFQFLGQDKTGKRSTGAICTPGTYVDVNGETVKKHVIQHFILIIVNGFEHTTPFFIPDSSSML